MCSVSVLCNGDGNALSKVSCSSDIDAILKVRDDGFNETIHTKTE